MKRILLILFLSTLCITGFSQAKDTLSRPQEKRFFISLTAPEVDLLRAMLNNTNWNHSEVMALFRVIDGQLNFQIKQMQQQAQDTSAPKNPPPKKQ